MSLTLSSEVLILDMRLRDVNKISASAIKGSAVDRDVASVMNCMILRCIHPFKRDQSIHRD